MATQIILFLTDGEDCTLNSRQPCVSDIPNGGRQDGSGPDTVLNRIAEKQAELVALGSVRANILTFSMTTNTDDRLPKIMSCENDGSWEAIGGKAQIRYCGPEMPHFAVMQYAVCCAGTRMNHFVGATM